MNQRHPTITREQDGISYLVLPSFQVPGLVHGFFTRHGGVSPFPWDFLNVGFGLGDPDENVAENRRRLKTSLGLMHLVSSRQVHGARVLVIDKPLKGDLVAEGYDAFVTDQADVGLMIQQADCQAIMFHGPTRAVIGIAHVGWRGSVAGIIEKTVLAMKEAFGVLPEDLKAIIGPSLGPCCAEFVNYQQELPEGFRSFQVRPFYFDFWAISRAQLMTAGIPEASISSAAICTVCEQSFFSYRRDQRTGRFAAVIGFKP